MDDKSLPPSVGQSFNEPVQYPNLEEICERLNRLYISSGLSSRGKPSEIFKGALSAMHHQNEKQNPEWMNQAAHSLREILYPYYSPKNYFKKTIIFSNELQEYGTIVDLNKFLDEINLYYGFFTSIAHHNLEEAKRNKIADGDKINPLKFRKIVHKFGDVLFSVLRRQLDAHQELEKIIKLHPSELTNLDYLESLVGLNEDLKRYFFFKADERWVEFLWGRGFLDALKITPEDPSRYSFSLAELGFLEKISENKPDFVTSIILDDEVATFRNKFNPEVIDRFIRIASNLPPEHLVKVINKIKDQEWVKLMGDFSQWGFEYSKILEILNNAKAFESILVLSSALIDVRDKENFEQRSSKYLPANPFYINDFGYVRVFLYLNNIEEDFLGKALEILIYSFKNILELGDKSNRNSVFEISDVFPFFDIDLFSLSPSQGEHFTDTGNVRELIASIIHITKRVFESYKNDKKSLNEIYKKFYEKLPDSQLVWRLKLVILSLKPEIFIDKLEVAFLRIFSEEKTNQPIYELIYGTEYQKALRESFRFQNYHFIQNYLSQIITTFGPPYIDEKDKNRKELYGSRILSCINSTQLTNEVRECEKKLGYKCDLKYIPKPIIGESRGGTVTPKAPISKNEFAELSIQEIVELLIGDWAPETLKENNLDSDFFNPINAEGVGDLLKLDISERVNDYLKYAQLFFNRKKIHEHYTYSFLVGIRDLIRLDSTDKNIKYWGNLIDLILSIKKSGEDNSFIPVVNSIDYDTGLISSWRGVHFIAAEILDDICSISGEKEFLNFASFRDKYFSILQYLFDFPNPTPDDELIESAAISEENGLEGKMLVSDPFTLAINSVRGQTFSAFIKFIFKDNSNKVDNKRSGLSNDVMKLYEDLINKEDTRAIRFLLGRYIPAVFFRNREFLKSSLQNILMNKSQTNHLYIATWEGYLSTDLYQEIFFDTDFQNLYMTGLSITSEDDPNRNYFIDPEEGLARHLALAFIYFTKDFHFESDLFEKFWESSERKRIEFINFIGRGIISNESEKNKENLQQNPEARTRIREFWRWIIKNHSNPKLLQEFGHWIDFSNEIFSVEEMASFVKQTLEISNGKLTWDFGLEKCVSKFACEFPEISVDIMRLFLLEGKVRNCSENEFFYLDDKWLGVFSSLYSNPKSRNKTDTLINHLVQDGKGKFWKFKEILE